MNKVLVKQNNQSAGNNEGRIIETSNKRLPHTICHLEELYDKYNKANHIYGNKEDLKIIRDEIDEYIINFSSYYRNDQILDLMGELKTYLSEENEQLKNYTLYRLGFSAIRRMYGCGIYEDADDKTFRLFGTGMLLFSMLDDEKKTIGDNVGTEIENYLKDFYNSTTEQKGRVLGGLDFLLNKDRSEATTYILSGLCEDLLNEKFCKNKEAKL